MQGSGCRTNREHRVNDDGSLNTKSTNLAKHYRDKHPKQHAASSMKTLMVVKSDGTHSRTVELPFEQQLKHHIDYVFAVAETVLDPRIKLDKCFTAGDAMTVPEVKALYMTELNNVARHHAPLMCSSDPIRHQELQEQMRHLDLPPVPTIAVTWICSTIAVTTRMNRLHSRCALNSSVPTFARWL